MTMPIRWSDRPAGVLDLIIAPRSREPGRLLAFAARRRSQADEDGLLAEVFRRIGSGDKRFLEVGAGDGGENNTHHLLDQGWHGTWIDADAASCARATAIAEHDFPGRLRVFQHRCTKEEPLPGSAALGPVDLLSLDIDGNDPHVLPGLVTGTRPRVIIAEYNATRGPAEDWTMPYDPAHRWDGSDRFGGSLVAMDKALQPEYALVGCSLSGVNGIWVRRTESLEGFASPFTPANHFEPPRYGLVAEWQAQDRLHWRTEAGKVPFWFHAITFPDGFVTAGLKGADLLKDELARLRLPDLQGKTVLDVGAWDGFYSFEAERLGADQVVALDHLVWGLDRAKGMAYWEASRKAGRVPGPLVDNPLCWDPVGLPGKRGFDLAHQALGSRVRWRFADFMTVDLDAPYDVVLFMGVLYHLQHPLMALQRLARATRELAIIESEAIVVPGQEDRAIWEFYEADQLAGDFTNWWVPNASALVSLCRTAGFARAEVVSAVPRAEAAGPPIHYRIVVHAHK